MANEEYEILPHQLLSDLKDEVEALKKKISQPDTKMNELILEIESLKDSIHDLNGIFHKALEETKEEDAYNVIGNLKEQMGDVISQNETIAKGMIAISDKLEDFMHGNSSPHPMTHPGIQHKMGMPAMPGSKVAPPPQPMNSGGIDMPPPPPSMGSMKKKSGLFG